MSDNLPAKKPKKLATTKLTPQQKLFVEALFADRKLNPESAARQAGFAKGMGSKLMANKEVRKVVDNRLQMRLWEHRVTADRVLLELQCIAFQNPQDLCNEDGTVKSLAQMPQQVARGIRKLRFSLAEEYNEDTGESVTVRSFDIDFHDKMMALDMLMKHLGMYDAIRHEVKTVVDWNEMIIPHANYQEAKEAAAEEDEIENLIGSITPLPGTYPPGLS